MPKKWKIDRIIRLLTLATAVVAVCLAIRKPQPVAPPQTPAMAAANVQSFQKKFQQLEKPRDGERQITEASFGTT